VIAVLFVALAILTLGYVALWIYEARKHPDTPDRGAPNAERIAVGFFANFFDSLGIGSFATTTTYYRLRKLVRDEYLPGTLNVGHCLPTITEAFIGIAIIAVDPLTMIPMIAAAVAGAWFGAGVVSRLPRRAIQVGMGIALLVAAGFLFAKVTGLMPSDEVRVGPADTVLRADASATAPPVATLKAGTPLELVRAGREWSEVTVKGAATKQTAYVATGAAVGIVLGVTGLKLALGLLGSFFLGSIMPLGIGYYAPCMVLVALLGMTPTAAFPIMMGACAFLMPVASAQFVRKKKYSLRAAAGLATGGIFGAALALLVVKSLDLYYVMWLVTVVIIYTGVSLLRAAAAEKRAGVGA
jgi:Sulfite exporter TauE/SafE